MVDLSEKTQAQLEYWRIFQQYLVEERERRRERIHEALRSRAVPYESDTLVRIVDSRYQTRPLSSFGSIVVPPGGRFNFGEISSYHQKFQALYLASAFRTAAAERFLRDQALDDQVDPVSLDLRLDPNASFSSYRVRASNLSVIDIRDTESLRPFLEVIAEIKVPVWLSLRAKQLKQPNPRTVTSIEQLRSLLLDPIYTQWGSLIDQASSSQWFGYYVRQAGLHGIIYPSVRHADGFNLVVFPDTLKETEARIELIDAADGVRPEDRVMDGGNVDFHMQISMKNPQGAIH